MLFGDRSGCRGKAYRREQCYKSGRIIYVPEYKPNRRVEPGTRAARLL